MLLKILKNLQLLAISLHSFTRYPSDIAMTALRHFFPISILYKTCTNFKNFQLLTVIKSLNIIDMSLDISNRHHSDIAMTYKI